jgi:AcrR family transcriptional regulator
MARTADDAPLIPLELPVADGDHRERADAQRNRLKVLAAAERLFACHGVENVSMDAIAAEAGVGKGTLFRRFGDRAGLALALLHEQTAALQEQIIRGTAT